MTDASRDPADDSSRRKARGAFFTPTAIAHHIATWALRSADDKVFEPAAGDAQFLIEAVKRLKSLDESRDVVPTVYGVEIHEHSAQTGSKRVQDAGGASNIEVADFFDVEPAPVYTAVIGNPPYVRYQDWTGDARLKSRAAALRGGVSLTGLSSSWAAFVVQSAAFLKPGGRLGLVLPAELLSVNYAAPVRHFLFERFQSIDVVLFDEQVFPEAEADVVLLLADGYGLGSAKHATIRQTRNASTLPQLEAGQQWTPTDPADKWTGAGIIAANGPRELMRLVATGQLAALETWGDTTLGMVTGNNNYFALSPARVSELNLDRRDLLRLSPPGSSHLRGLALTGQDLTALGREGKSTWLFRPRPEPGPAALKYINAGHSAGVDKAYKCRVRKTWYEVPLVRPADLLLTCMNADTPRLTTNEAGAFHLNSVHGLYLSEGMEDLGRELLPLASLNSITLLSAEMVGRAYGGGILKLEPREADRWLMPSPVLVQQRADALRSVRQAVADRLARSDLLGAVALVDTALLLESDCTTPSALEHVRAGRAELAKRRTNRGKRGRTDGEK